MSDLELLVADPASPEWRSPLARVSLPDGIRDVSAEPDDVSALGPATGAAGLELFGPRAVRTLRRLTDLDLDRLPAVGPVAHVRALVRRPEPERFRIWVPEEYAGHVAASVVDAWEGLA